MIQFHFYFIFIFLRNRLIKISNLFFFNFILFFFIFSQLSSGFIGAEKFYFFYAGILLSINTFGAELLFSLLFYFVFRFTLFRELYDDNFMSSQNIGSEIQSHVSSENSQIIEKKIKNSEIEIKIVESSKNRNKINVTTATNISDINKIKKESSTFISNEIGFNFIFVWGTYKLLVLTASCFCAFLHRRHLMVWAVFAPKVSKYASPTKPVRNENFYYCFLEFYGAHYTPSIHFYFIFYFIYTVYFFACIFFFHIFFLTK